VESTGGEGGGAFAALSFVEGADVVRVEVAAVSFVVCTDVVGVGVFAVVGVPAFAPIETLAMSGV
jgi:hypothetical protein